MKTNKLFIGAFALLLAGLASCSDEEPVVNTTPPADDVIDGDKKYMSVIIATSSDDSRALPGNTEFTDGDGNECSFQAKDMVFLFFDEGGNPFPLAASNVYGTTVSNSVIPTSVEDVHGSGDVPGTKARLVLGKAVGEGYIGTQPAQVLCLINHAGRINKLDDIVNKPLSSVLQTTAGLPTNLTDPNVGFFMTSSTYYDPDEDKVMTAMPLDGCFKNDPDAADAAPVVIYVERVVAKIRVTGLHKDLEVQTRNETTKAVSVKDFSVDNKPLKLKVSLEGWDLIKTSTSNYVFKHITLAEAQKNNKTGYFTDWNDPSKHRCYWTEPQHPARLGNADYDIYNEYIDDATTGEEVPNPNYVKNDNWVDHEAGATGADTDIAVQNVEYCLENTRQPASINDRTSFATGIVVRAEVKADTTNDGTENYVPITLVRWAGAYYTYDGFRKLVAQTYNGSVSSELQKIDYNAVSLVRDEKLNSNPNYFVAQIQLPGSSDTQKLETFKNVLLWYRGRTSYYINIEHKPGTIAATDTEPEKKLYGVVRNHIYHYDLNGVIGLGIPGNNPVMDDETESFLSARIYCLNWRVVNNTVTLE